MLITHRPTDIEVDSYNKYGVGVVRLGARTENHALPCKGMRVLLLNQEIATCMLNLTGFVLLEHLTQSHLSL
jgi:hypothetical protein